MYATLGVIATISIALWFFVRQLRTTRAWVRSFSRLGEIESIFAHHHAAEARKRAVRERFPPDLVPLATEFGPDHVQMAFFRSGRTLEESLYRDAKDEIMAAFRAGRLPAPWAVETVRAYRDAFAAAAECEAARLREETARVRRAANEGRTEWQAEIVRPRHARGARLPN